VQNIKIKYIENKNKENKNVQMKTISKCPANKCSQTHFQIDLMKLHAIFKRILQLRSKLRKLQPLHLGRNSEDKK